MIEHPSPEWTAIRARCMHTGAASRNNLTIRLSFAGGVRGRSDRAGASARRPRRSGSGDVAATFDRARLRRGHGRRDRHRRRRRRGVGRRRHDAGPGLLRRVGLLRRGHEIALGRRLLGRHRIRRVRHLAGLHDLLRGRPCRRTGRDRAGGRGGLRGFGRGLGRGLGRNVGLSAALACRRRWRDDGGLRGRGLGGLGRRVGPRRDQEIVDGTAALLEALLEPGRTGAAPTPGVALTVAVLRVA